jgi:hypothetical protein
MEGKYEKAQNGDYDEAFLRRFAAQIGTALREREDDKDKQSSNIPSIEESVEDLYRSLVFDEPSIYHISNLPVVASALARQLLSSSSTTSSFALCNRLLNGVIYLCNQNTTTVVAKSENENESESNNHNDTVVHSTIKTAMAKLAFCILIDIPLECCRDENSSSESNMNKIRNLLGSYKGSSMHDRNNHEENTTKSSTSTIDDDGSHSNNIHNEDKKRSMSNFMKNNDDINSSSSSDNKEDGNINNAGEEIQQQKQQFIVEEVWATESDPSDYDFGEDTPADDITSAGANKIQEENDWLDPKILSRPDLNLTLQQTRDSIGTLLQLASYTLLESIFYLPQKDTSRYASQLTQLVLILLKPRRKDRSTPSSLPESSLLDSSVDYAILYPLWILRDAAAYHTNSISKTTRQSCTTNYGQIYLEILQTLLAIDQAYLQDIGSSATSIKATSDPDFDLCVASIVGLSALSAWCSMQKKSTQSTVDAIVDSMNDLSHVVERAEQTYKKNLPNTLIPILVILSGICYDHVDNNISSTSSVPQTLLNSGFLRQILALLTLDGEASTRDLLGFHHALWGLCQSFPKIVGKYVFRYPGSSQIIRSYATNLGSSSPQNCVQSILWNIYGWYQCKQSSLASGGMNTVLKKIGSSTSDGKKPLNTSRLIEDECSEVCSKAWSQLCKLVIQALEASSTNRSDDAGAEKVIQEWGRLLVLSRISSIATHFKSLIDPSLLDDISIVISSQSKQIKMDKTDELESREDGKANDDKKDDDKERRKPSRRQRIISQAHKVLKEYKLFFLGTVVGTSKTD